MENTYIEKENEISGFLKGLVIALWVITGLSILLGAIGFVGGQFNWSALASFVISIGYIVAGYFMWKGKIIGLFTYLGLKAIRIVMFFTVELPLFKAAFANNPALEGLPADTMLNITMGIVLIGKLIFPVLFLVNIRQFSKS